MTDAYPSLLWTALPTELVLDGLEAPQATACVELSVEGRLLQVLPGGDGMGTVQRLISTNPHDYLDPRWQPGAPISLARGH